MRVRIGKGKRPSIALSGCAQDEASLETRRVMILRVAEELVISGRAFDVEAIAKALGAATTDRELRVLRTAASRLAASGPGVGRHDDTFADFASRWTRGDLTREYPDYVAPKDARSDIGILKLYVNPVVGHIPLVSFEQDHANSVMRLLPSSVGKARRRHVAQVIHRVLRLAAFPAKIIKVSPLPEGWLPKLGKGKALTYLFPDEDAKLLASRAVQIDYRVFYGLLDREGFRETEALDLAWSDLDLKRGAVVLDENKSDVPRSWALDDAVVRTLTWWKKRAPKDGPFKRINRSHIATRLRADLELAGVDRVQLFETTKARRQIRIHDLRATFVTLSLAAGKSESWVQDRTGHTSTLMIARYRRASRTVAELGLGSLAPLDEAIPEVLEKAQLEIDFAASRAPAAQGGDRLGQFEQMTISAVEAILISDDMLVAPSGLEPERSFEPEILKPRRRGRVSSAEPKNRPGRARSVAPKTSDPHPDPHPGAPTSSSNGDGTDDRSMHGDAASSKPGPARTHMEAEFHDRTARGRI